MPPTSAQKCTASDNQDPSRFCDLIAEVPFHVPAHNIPMQRKVLRIASPPMLSSAAATGNVVKGRQPLKIMHLLLCLPCKGQSVVTSCEEELRDNSHVSLTTIVDLLNEFEGYSCINYSRNVDPVEQLEGDAVVASITNVDMLNGLDGDSRIMVSKLVGNSRIDCSRNVDPVEQLEGDTLVGSSTNIDMLNELEGHSQIPCSTNVCTEVVEQLSRSLNSYLDVVNMSAYVCCGFSFILCLIDSIACFSHATPMKSNSSGDVQSSFL